MKNAKKDIEYINLIENILDNNNFMETQKDIHHGLKKLDHSMKVSYYSYKFAKNLNMDYMSVARAGLLHDFFSSNGDGKGLTKDAIRSTWNHHNIALDNASSNFNLNDMEKDIIVKHMFPVVLTIPRYKESLLVSVIDKGVGTFEFIQKFRRLLNYKMLSKVIPAYLIFISITN